MRLALLGDERNPDAVTACRELAGRYRFVDEDEAEVGVVVGGDGFLLHTLHRLLDLGLDLPLYGLNRGTVGFLLNPWSADRLPERVAEAETTTLQPLELRARDGAGVEHVALALNEVALFRASGQSASIEVQVDGDRPVQHLFGDGILLSTAAGSTAYNRSAGGPIVPLTAQLLALTPIAVFHPRGWRGALLPQDSHVRFVAHEAHKRPVNATADHHEIPDVREVEVRVRLDVALRLLFDPGHSLEGRILREQFAT